MQEFRIGALQALQIDARGGNVILRVVVTIGAKRQTIAEHRATPAQANEMAYALHKVAGDAIDQRIERHQAASRGAA